MPYYAELLKRAVTASLLLKVNLCPVLCRQARTTGISAQLVV